jgi:hypothetical protein
MCVPTLVPPVGCFMPFAVAVGGGGTTETRRGPGGAEPKDLIHRLHNFGVGRVDALHPFRSVALVLLCAARC